MRGRRKMIVAPNVHTTVPWVCSNTETLLDSVPWYGIHAIPDAITAERELEALNAKNWLALGVFAAIGASLCCVAPLVLLALGISGAWIGNLTAMEPYRPIFVGFTLAFLGLAFRKLYLVPQVCQSGTRCAGPLTLTRTRAVFWVLSLVLLALLALPLAAPLFY